MNHSQAYQQFIDRATMAAKENLLAGIVVAAGTAQAVNVLWAWGRAALCPQETPMTAESIFEIASVTKAVATASACGICIDEGLLDPEASATTYLPTLGGGTCGEIRVCDLATHLSGFDHRYFFLEKDEDFLPSFVESPAQWPPRTKYEYSCRNLIILGAIVEKVTGQRLDRFCAERIFGPVGMHESLWGPIPAQGNRVVPTHVLAGMISDKQARIANRPIGNAGLFSTAGDLAKFCRMMLNRGYAGSKQIFGSKAMSWLMKQCSPKEFPPHSFGWNMCPTVGIDRPTRMSPGAIGHSGWTGQSLWIDPENDVFTIVLTNRAHAAVYGVGSMDNYEASKHFRSQLGDLLFDCVKGA